MNASPNGHPTIEILEEIGRGEFATVFRARDTSLKRFVAVKELHESMRGDRRRFDQFCAEAQFLANLRHDNIVQVHGLDRDRGWIIMELMQGSLAARLAEGPLPPDLVRGAVRQCLEGLRYLHQQGKFHGAIKPANLLIDDRGRVKLSDSAGVSPGAEFLKPRGSWKYMAPELCNPAFGPVGPGLDLYGLGFTALELLKGRSFDAMFKGVGADAVNAETGWMRWHGSSEERLFPTQTIVPSCPPDLAAVIDRLLVKEVAGRYPSAEMALKDLDVRPIPLFAVPEPTAEMPGRMMAPPRPIAPAPAHPAPAHPARPGRPARPGHHAAHKPWTKAWFNAKFEKPAAQVGLAAAILMIPVLFIAASEWSKRSNAKPDKGGVEDATAKAARIAAQVAKDEKDREDRERIKRMNDWIAGEIRRQKDEIPPGRGGGNDPVAKQGPPPAEVVTAPVEPPPKPADRPETIAAAPPRPRAESPEIRRYQAHQGTTFGVAFSGDGKRLVSGGADGTIKVWDPAQEKVTRTIADAHQGRILSVDITPDGRLVASAGEDHAVRYWDLESGEKMLHERRFKPLTWQIALYKDPVGIWCALGQEDGVGIWSPNTDRYFPRIGVHDGEVTAVALPPDGTHVVSGDVRGRIINWDLKSSRAPKEHVTFDRGHAGLVNSVAIDDAGGRVLSGGDDGSARLWDARTGKAIKSLLPGGGGEGTEVGAVAFYGPDLALTAGYDKIIRLWDIESGTEIRQFAGHGDAVQCLAVDAANRRFASGGKDGRVILWSLPDKDAAASAAREAAGKP